MLLVYVTSLQHKVYSLMLQQQITPCPGNVNTVYTTAKAMHSTRCEYEQARGASLTSVAYGVHEP
jgi:hypothetical protein